MTLYQSKQHTVDAIQWTGENLEEVKAFLGKNYFCFTNNGHTLWYGLDKHDTRETTDQFIQTGEVIGFKPDGDLIRIVSDFYEVIPTENLPYEEALKAMKQGKCANDTEHTYCIHDGYIWVWNRHLDKWDRWDTPEYIFNAEQILSNNWRIVSDPEKEGGE